MSVSVELHMVVWHRDREDVPVVERVNADSPCLGGRSPADQVVMHVAVRLHLDDTSAVETRQVTVG